MTATRNATAVAGGTGTPSGWFDVTASPYSAVGNDTADDTAAIQSAINAAQAVGGVVYFPPGKTFKITSTLTVAQTAPVTLQGGSGQSWSQINTSSPVLHYTGGAGSGPLLKMVGAALSVTLMGLRFTYSNSAYTGAGTDLVDFHPSGADAQLNRVINCSFNSTFAVDASHGAHSLLRLNEFIIGEVRNCHFGGCQDAILAGDGTSFVVSTEIANCTFNFAQSSFIRLGSGDIEAMTIRNCTFEDCPTNGAIYGDGTNQTYSMTIADNWFGDSGGTNTVAWINGVSAQSNLFTGIIQGNRMAANPWALKIVGDWLVIGNTFETGGCYRTSTFQLTDIANFYNMNGANVFEAGHPPSGGNYKMMGSHASSGTFNASSESHFSSATHFGGFGAATGINELTDNNAQLSLGVNGTNGAGVIASANRALIYTDFNTGYNGPGILRIQAPAQSTANELQLIAGTSAPVPLVRCTSGNQLSFFNATPVVKPATTGTTTGFTAGAGTAVKDDSTFTGGVGATAYRISDVVLALKQLGLMAA